jgi:DNA polymerase-1
MPVKKSDTPKKTRLVLLDAHAILHRAYHALPDFTSPGGEPTGALYGLTNMILKMVTELKPDYIVACFDLEKPTYRHEVYEGYKAGRKKTDDALSVQINRSREVFAALNIPLYELEGFEADDLLGTIVEKTKKDKNLEVIIASGDMDTMQLISGTKVQVYTLKKGIQDTIMYDEKAVEGRFGFLPELLPDYKGLRGDPSDNIIGIPGIGEKTATDLITQFGTIEDIYKKLKKDEKQFLEKGIKQRIIELLKEHEEEALFSKALATIRRDAPIDFALPKLKWRDGLEMAPMQTLFTELGFRSLQIRIKDLFGTKSLLEDIPVEEEVVEDAFNPMELRKAAIALWLLKSDITNPKLDDVLEYTRKKTVHDALLALEADIKKENLEKVYEEIELPLIPVLDAMHDRGVLIDIPYLKDLSKEYHTELAKIEKRIYKAAGQEFNVSSPKQLGDILFDKLGLVVKNQKKTGTGQKSTKESELEKMRGMHPIIEDIFAYRELQKLLGTYIDTIPTQVDQEGRLHSEFLQAGSATGRMASQNPNIQNIPIKTELGRRIRNAFIAPKGFVLASLDYSQIELRIAAFLSKDPKLSAIFTEGGDIHQAVAAQVFGVPPEKVDSEMRRRAKVINFGILYGMGVNALRENLGTTRAEAQEFYDNYFNTFTGLAEYLEETKRFAAKNGYTLTYFGRKRRFEGIKSSLPFIRAAAERMAINAPMQGTQADIIKIAMARIFDYFKKEQIENDAHLLLQVHDELVFEIKKELVDELVPKIKSIMESVLTLKETNGVPVKTEAKIGKNWGEMQKM